ncbi:Nif3-like dinuclear metal center hexameric protein [Persicitalea jodogahamensis]|uniref:GTP cyclohydrolase 1 type 2 homolog n=1 Tax=Persicitalea jodogahamensis TaxID=402147 RepID=A0A8J3D4Z7_9BACT|nr:Nif3-like dinuclear metal center hexameric protein [Persicitalea jodogahamensis]GHB76126.1 GTP cyclohydrolase 1 type 2 [Persicitalea jodogahamensis]
MSTLQELIDSLETLAPPAYQETYDNSGLIVGDPNTEISGVLLSLDCTEEIVEEATRRGCNVVVAHHPIVFKGLKRLNGKNYVERTVIKAIRNQVAIYAIHTNLDHVTAGVNSEIASRLGLKNVKILAPKRQLLRKLTFFVPLSNADQVLDKLYEAGAGTIGNYSECSFRVNGEGTFRPLDGATPFSGKVGRLERASEQRVELMFPSHVEGKVMQALRRSHPYEEVAYYLHTLENENQEVGAGAIGELSEPLPVADFLAHLKKRMNVSVIKHTASAKPIIERVAVCGGAGSFLLPNALAAGADAFVTADFKYHEFFDAENRIVICDIGHYESEVFTKQLLYDYLSKIFGNFALHLSETNTNPVAYYY